LPRIAGLIAACLLSDVEQFVAVRFHIVADLGADVFGVCVEKVGRVLGGELLTDAPDGTRKLNGLVDVSEAGRCMLLVYGCEGRW